MDTSMYPNSFPCSSSSRPLKTAPQKFSRQGDPSQYCPHTAAAGTGAVYGHVMMVNPMRILRVLVFKLTARHL